MTPTFGKMSSCGMAVLSGRQSSFWRTTKTRLSNFWGMIYQTLLERGLVQL